MQTASSTVWTRLTDSISNDYNRFTSLYSFAQVMEEKRYRFIIEPFSPTHSAEDSLIYLKFLKTCCKLPRLCISWIPRDCL